MAFASPVLVADSRAESCDTRCERQRREEERKRRRIESIKKRKEKEKLKMKRIEEDRQKRKREALERKQKREQEEADRKERRMLEEKRKLDEEQRKEEEKLQKIQDEERRRRAHLEALERMNEAITEMTGKPSMGLSILLELRGKKQSDNEFEDRHKQGRDALGRKHDEERGRVEQEEQRLLDERGRLEQEQREERGELQQEAAGEALRQAAENLEEDIESGYVVDTRSLNPRRQSTGQRVLDRGAIERYYQEKERHETARGIVRAGRGANTLSEMATRIAVESVTGLATSRFGEATGQPLSDAVTRQLDRIWDAVRDRHRKKTDRLLKKLEPDPAEIERRIGARSGTIRAHEAITDYLKERGHRIKTEPKKSDKALTPDRIDVGDGYVYNREPDLDFVPVDLGMRIAFVRRDIAEKLDRVRDRPLCVEDRLDLEQAMQSDASPEMRNGVLDALDRKYNDSSSAQDKPDRDKGHGKEPKLKAVPIDDGDMAVKVKIEVEK